MPTESPLLDAAGSLWDFAVSLYGKPGVEEACLALQNRLGADVNMMMFCLWLAACDEAPADLPQFLASGLKISRDWQKTLIEPLRSCRHRLKELAASEGIVPSDTQAILLLRENVKKCELEAERLQIGALARLVARAERAPAGGPAAHSQAAGNLEVYFSAAGVTLDPLGQSHVLRILNAAFGP